MRIRNDTRNRQFPDRRTVDFTPHQSADLTNFKFANRNQFEMDAVRFLVAVGFEAYRANPDAYKHIPKDGKTAAPVDQNLA